MGIPIVIGVTGHRDLREQDVPQLRKLFTAELKKLIAQYPNSEFVLLDSLASGADSLCAEAALALGIQLVCPLPLPVAEYRKDFSAPDLAIFDALLHKASDVFLVPNTEPLPVDPTRDFHYRQAGIYVAAHSHVLFALWDGEPAKPDGCGTAETVGFMLLGNYKDVHGCCKAEQDGAVLHILTPRQGGEKEASLSVRLLENKPGSLGEILRKIDVCNSDAKQDPEDAENSDI